MWRVCRLGEIDDDRYVSLAMGFLASINDSDAQTAEPEKVMSGSRSIVGINVS